MTLSPATLARSAVEITDDDGLPVATIYARSHGIEIVCQDGWTAEYTAELHDTGHLGISLLRTSEVRRR